jgi:Carboxylesterase family
MGSISRTLPVAAALISAAGIAVAQVPPDIAKELVTIGRGVCVPETAFLYAPLQPKGPFSNVKFTRDISFGPDAKDVLDIAEPAKGGGSHTVLMYISGGAGNKQQGGQNGEAFYDNVMVWAVKNGMVGVNVQRHPGKEWDDPAKATGLAVAWVDQNIAMHKGNPARVFIWTQSAGNIPVSTYVGHSELWGPKGVGVKGVLFMSPPAFDILPATPPPVQGGGGGGFGACGKPAGYTAAEPPAGGGRGRGPGGPGGAGGFGRAQVDPATQLARSNLPGLISSKVPFMVAVAELDPPNIIGFAQTLKDELCKANRCPTYVTFKDHSHISEVLAPDTKDDSVTGPILKWIKSVK